MTVPQINGVSQRRCRVGLLRRAAIVGEAAVGREIVPFGRSKG